MAELRPRLQPLLASTRLRFLIVGAWNTLFGYLLFLVLYALFSRLFSVGYFAYTSAQVVGSVLAILNAYFSHKHGTFRSKARGREGWLEFFRFTQTYAAMFVLGLVLLPFLVEVCGLGPRVGALVATGIGVIVSYVGHRFVTFRQQDGGGL